MKTSAFIATLLTFLMVILVLGAGALFLWQGRQLLENEVSSLEATAVRGGETATAVRAYADARDEALATSESLRATQEAVLATRAAEYEASLYTQRIIASSRATLAVQNATQEALLAPLALPLVNIAYPDEGAAFTNSATVPIIVTAGHPQRVLSVTLQIDGDTVVFAGSDAPYDVYAHRLLPPLVVGEYLITATITSTEHLTATDSLRFTVIRSQSASEREP